MTINAAIAAPTIRRPVSRALLRKMKLAMMRHNTIASRLRSSRNIDWIAANWTAGDSLRRPTAIEAR